jgi:hypothetical protein
MTRSEAIKFFGGIPELARVLDITYEAVRQWPEDGIPLLRQYQIQELSEGALKVSGKKQSQVTAA